EARAVADEAALLRHIRPLVDRRQAQRRGALDDRAAIGEQERGGQHVEWKLWLCRWRARFPPARRLDVSTARYPVRARLPLAPRAAVAMLSRCRQRPPFGEVLALPRSEFPGFAVQIGGEQAYSRGVGAGAGKRTDQPCSHHIVGKANDRNCCCRCLLRGTDSEVPASEYDVDLGPNDFRRKL